MAHEAVAHYVHVLIYALLVGNGVAGTVGWLASGDPIVLFGLDLRGAHEPAPLLARICLAIGFATARAPRWPARRRLDDQRRDVLGSRRTRRYAVSRGTSV